MANDGLSMKNSLGKKLIRFAQIVGANFLVFVLLFALAELAYRIYRDGVPGAFVNLAENFGAAPNSNLGTHNWVIGDAVIGYRLNPNQPGVNRLSIRGGDVAIPKPPGLFRLIVLGDSIPWDNPGFVRIMSDRLSQTGTIEVINASVPGYTTYQELMFLKTYLLDTSPDLVILTYCLNDNYKFLHRFNENGQMLWTAEAEESLQVNSVFGAFVSRSYILTKLKLGFAAFNRPRVASQFPWDNREDFNAAWKDESWAPNETYLAEMADVLARRGSRFAIVVFPFEPQLDERYLTADYAYTLKPQTKLKTICDRYRVPCLDLFPTFRDYRRQGAKLFRDGIHLTPAGHDVAAATILDFVRAPSNGLLNANPSGTQK